MADDFFVADPNQPVNPNQPMNPNQMVNPDQQVNPNQPMNPNQPINPNPSMNPNQPINPAPGAPVGMGMGNPAGAPGGFPAPGAMPTGPGFNPGVAAASLNASMGPQGHFVPGGAPVGAPTGYPASNPNPGMATGMPGVNPGYAGGPAPMDQGPFVPQSPQALVNDRLYGEEIGTLDFGQKRPRWPINKFKGVMGKTQRISVLSLEKGDWFALPEHFIPTIRGYAYCFKGACFSLGSPKTMYVIPVLTYLDLDNNGNVISDRVSYEFLSLAEKKYNDLIAIGRFATLLDIDLYVSCESDQFQELKFSIVGANGAATKAAWKVNPQFQQAVWNEFQRVKVWMLQANARVLGNTKQEAEINFQKLLSQPVQGGPANPGVGGGFRPPTSNFNPQQWGR